MKRTLSIIGLGLVLILPFLLSGAANAQPSSQDLTGVWSCDDGGRYYIRQLGDRVYWYGEQADQGPGWTNVFVGTIRGHEIRGTWSDVPKGSAAGSGDMTLRVRHGGTRLEATYQSGGFGGTNWRRN